MELSKDLVGKFIYGRTTGNASRGGAKVVKFQVVKVKRKYFDLIQYFNLSSDSEHKSVDSYCPSLGALESQIRIGYGGNTGYKFFNTQEEAQRDIDQDKIMVEIHQNISNIRNLSYDEVVALRDILVKNA